MSLALGLQLLFLLSPFVFSTVNGCTPVTQAVTMQLSNNHILRTWQPDGAHCRWWESRQSETNRFPAAVRSGPRWLVMQLRQPLMLEAVSVQDWDGQWQSAAPVGSSVSAVGASSLPLELQLADPCQASWEVFDGGDYHWRQLGAAADESWKPTSFIRLHSESPLSWQAIKVTGRHPSIKLNMSLSKDDFSQHRYGLVVKEGRVDGRANIQIFVESSCRPQCWLLDFNNERFNVTYVASEGWTHKFERRIYSDDHGKMLQCGYDRNNIMLEELLLLEVKAEQLTLTISPILVAGRLASLIATSDSLPETQHHCFILRQGSQRKIHLDLQRITESGILDYRRRTLIRVHSKLIYNVSLADLNGSIHCKASGGSGRAKIAANLRIPAVSEPCQTTIDLGLRRQWLVGETQQIVVTSSRCSIWNVSHSCWLQLDGEDSYQRLVKVHQSGFNSTHELHVIESMIRQGWQVLCSVNQSGLEYEVSKSVRSAAPTVLYNGDKHPVKLYVALAVVGQLLIIFAVAMATWRISVCRRRLPQPDGGLEKHPSIHLEQTGASSSQTAPYEIPSSEYSTAANDSSGYERVSSGGTCSSRRTLPLPPAPSFIEECRYINWRQSQQRNKIGEEQNLPKP